MALGAKPVAIVGAGACYPSTRAPLGLALDLQQPCCPLAWSPATRTGSRSRIFQNYNENGRTWHLDRSWSTKMISNHLTSWQNDIPQIFSKLPQNLPPIINRCQKTISVQTNCLTTSPHENMKSLRVVFVVSSGVFSEKWPLTTNKAFINRKHEHEKEAHRETMTIRLINSSSTSGSNSDTKTHVWEIRGLSMDSP